MTEPFITRFERMPRFINRPADRVIQTIDMHAGGEPLRVVTGGYPSIDAASLLDYRRALQRDHDHLRSAIMLEPRGHADMYGCLVLPPFDSSADCSVIFMHNEGYSTMCGHAVIALMTLATEMGWVDIRDNRARLDIEAPCGLIKAHAEIRGREIRASFDCVPSFVAALGESLRVPAIGRDIDFDLAYGGAFYAYVDADSLNLELTPANCRQLIELGVAIKQAIIDSGMPIVHPFEDELGFLYGTIFVGKAQSAGLHSRNVCVFADGELDRSPTGSGISGRMAIHFQKHELALGQTVAIESILGSVFRAAVTASVVYGPYRAVVPRVEGRASVTGRNELIIDPRDEFRHGFLLR